jgi:hypothetical protein
MTESELERLERDVEQSLKRLTEGLALLRRPSALSEFKQDLISRAFRTKDDLVHQTTRAASTRAQQFLADIKSRAAVNPAAVFAIAAGLAWRLARHPPISSILVGLGIAGLLKTDPTSRPSPITVRATELANSASDLAGKVAQETQQRSMQAGRSATETLEQFYTTAGAGTSQAREAGRAALSKTAGVANDMSNTLVWIARDTDTRDNYLLGAAALAIGAAAVIGYRRRDARLS